MFNLIKTNEERAKLIDICPKFGLILLNCFIRGVYEYTPLLRFRSQENRFIKLNVVASMRELSEWAFNIKLRVGFCSYCE